MARVPPRLVNDGEMKDCEAILLVSPLPPQREASLRGGASKSIHGVFM